MSINTDENIQALTRDMKRLEKWSRKWLLKFNAERCATMHLGSRNPRAGYELDGVTLRKSSLEKDLGILVSEDLKATQQVKSAAAKGNKMVGLIRRTFTCLNVEMCRILYCTLVRPHIEYAIQSWSPYLRKDIDELEKVQKRMTRLVPELSNLKYEERCKRLGIYPLEKRRLRGDLIETYKIIHGLENLDQGIFFSMREGITRTNNFKLEKRGHWRTNLRANVFSIRVVNYWNGLPEDIVSAPSVSVFKKRLDEYWEIEGEE